MCASSHQANQTCGRCFREHADSSSDNINKLRAQRSARQYLFQLSESLSYLDKNHYFYSNRFNVLTLSTVHLATQLIDWNTTFELWAIVCIYFLNKCWTGRNMNLEKGSAIIHVASLELRESLSSNWLITLCKEGDTEVLFTWVGSCWIHRNELLPSVGELVEPNTFNPTEYCLQLVKLISISIW